jgi:hypothetical protein
MMPSFKPWHCRDLEKHFDLKCDESVEYANEEVGAPGTRCNDKILIFTNYTRYNAHFWPLIS